MTDSELIKALENSINTYNEKGVYVDTENLQQQAFDLLKRQKKELEAIKDEKAMVFKLSEEQINEIEEQINESKEDLLKSVEYNERKIKAEAYKEFAERLKEKLGDCYIVSDGEYCGFDCGDIHRTITNLLKEMVGEEE